MRQGDRQYLCTCPWGAIWVVPFHHLFMFFLKEMLCTTASIPGTHMVAVMRPIFVARGSWTFALGVGGSWEPPKTGGRVLKKGFNDRGHDFHWFHGHQKETFVNIGLHKRCGTCMSTTCC